MNKTQGENMIREGKRKGSKPRHGKSKGKCYKCGKEFLLKKTKHNKAKIIKADCGCEPK
jgi:hypothetical protein